MPHEPVAWVVLDLGETLVDETSAWTAWAEHLGVPTLTFFAVLGSVIAERRPHTDVFERLRPGFDFDAEVRAKRDAGHDWAVTTGDLYPDALPTLARLRADGFRVAVMANQPRSVEPFLGSLPVDRWATSASWGVAKPAPEFFSRVCSELDVAASAVVYVGDRVDLDVVPARSAGMRAVHLERGPWGIIQRDWPEAAHADARIRDLASLPEVVAALSRS